MKSTNEIREIFELFNEKATKLLGSSFLESLLKSDTGVKISGKIKRDGSSEVHTVVRGPTQESIDAFILTFRFFIQNNESTSLGNIAQVYREASIDPEYLERFNSARNAVNQILDSPNSLNITFNESTPTNREVMNTFIYGGLAHANPVNKEQFDTWMAFPPISGLFQACFSLVLGHVLRAIKFIADLNHEVLSSLSMD